MPLKCPLAVGSEVPSSGLDGLPKGIRCRIGSPLSAPAVAPGRSRPSSPAPTSHSRSAGDPTAEERAQGACLGVVGSAAGMAESGASMIDGHAAAAMQAA